MQNLRKAMNKKKGETKADTTKKLIESFKEIYAKKRNSEKLKREIKLTFKRKIDKN